ncbi:glycosyl hydrolase [Metarhizium album ARSEF 1941]|uniref:Glycosyl hydrolase n=1 Tax=Metarhizium album (strain ARSEF 1941) TaxID=1081103 RepID=A0A0B2X4D6_METAS|nr:glycosyl hydrolase [Metarhizium album ARSEF 1941]KHO00623.1 glycosyl hydrolase [Metarhizium album ARSEF 1941]
MMSKCSVISWASCLAFTSALLAKATPATTKAQYVQDASTAITALNRNWYRQDTGLWDGAWWQSANALTTLADFAMLQPDAAKSLGIANTIRNTIENAPKKFPGFINDFYDDEGWWALGLIHAYDATRNERYLETAADIFNDMQTGGGTPCNGGVFWSKHRKYVNAVVNELYITVAASLANRIPSNRTYFEIAKNEWHWFRKSGMINSQYLINDGLDASCKNNGLQTWSVNQGVLLGGLTELSKGPQMSRGVLGDARTLAKAAIRALSDEDGILVETDKCETQNGACGFDGKQFKGVFVRNLAYLDQVLKDRDIRAFVLRNADSVWDKNHDPSNKMGVAWKGPVIAANGASHGSALDALVAAVRVV